MSSLQHRAHSQRDTVSLQVPRDRFAPPDGRPRRNVSLMRKYEAAALLPNLSISQTQLVAPAIALFEDTCCAFARGTLIQTVRGPVAIEDLQPGDYVRTATGSEPVMWIGSTTYVPDATDDGSSLSGLTRMTSDAFGIGRPNGDLLIGPAARMVVRREKLRTLIGRDAVLVPVSDYTDGDRLFNVAPGGAVQLYHLMLAQHGVIDVGGMEMETYHPGKVFDPSHSQNTRALYLSLFPNINHIADFGELRMTRTSREVVDSLTLN